MDLSITLKNAKRIDDLLSFFYNKKTNSVRVSSSSHTDLEHVGLFTRNRNQKLKLNSRPNIPCVESLESYKRKLYVKKKLGHDAQFM